MPRASKMVRKLRCLRLSWINTVFIGIEHRLESLENVTIIIIFRKLGVNYKMEKNAKTYKSHWHCVYQLKYHFATHLAQYYWKPLLWTRAYCLITAGGAPIEILKQYIQNQGKPRQ